MGAGLAVTAWGAGRLDIMAITPDGDVAGRIWHRSYYDGAASWLDWHNPNAVYLPVVRRQSP